MPWQCPWVNARVAHLLSVCRMTTMEVCGNIAKESSPDSYNQVMFTQNRDHRGFLLLCGASESREGLHWRTY